MSKHSKIAPEPKPHHQENSHSRDFVEKHDWIEFLAKDPSIRSNTSVCFVLPQLDKDQVKKFVALLEEERVAYDIGAYRDAPDGLRIWCGATVDKADIEALLPWLEWAHNTVKNK